MITDVREPVPIFVGVGDGDTVAIGTVPCGANPHEVAAFFRAVADEIERTYVRAVDELIDQATYERWREEESRDHDR
jgi:hypothetical protein